MFSLISFMFMGQFFEAVWNTSRAPTNIKTQDIISYKTGWLKKGEEM